MAVPDYPGRGTSGGMSNTPALEEETVRHGASRSPDQEVRHRTEDLADKAGQTAKQQVDRRKEQAASRLGHVSGALRSTSDHLRDEDEPSIAEYVDKAAVQLDRFVGYLDEKSAEDLLHDTRQLARRDPALFLGGAAVLGLIGARFLRSSDRHRHRYDSNNDV